MADRRQVGISDGWRGQAPSRRKVVNRRSSCLRHHQRRLKTDPGCRSKTDPPGHATERDQPSIRRPFPPAGHLPRYPEPSGHNRRNQRSRCRNCWSRYRNHQIHGAGTTRPDRRNQRSRSSEYPYFPCRPVCSPRIRAPIEPHGSTAPNSRATPGMRALPNMKKKPGKGLCTAPRLLCHKPDSQRNSAHQETNLLFYIDFFVVPICGSAPGLTYSCGFGGDSPRFLTELSTVFVDKQFYPYKTMSYE